MARHPVWDAPTIRMQTGDCDFLTVAGKKQWLRRVADGFGPMSANTTSCKRFTAHVLDHIDRSATP
jgi:hypothetical protein